ncbi:jg17875 [Pararge aegeria aegeria]|uniref:Jg17875 protein n=1 Tax=Pararge aegeria aegeria TaxID=348720 RepID=A0A8S4SPZ5_9NEOP|nr:jg17875 [Pararge aegeria aegeria]
MQGTPNTSHVPYLLNQRSVGFKPHVAVILPHPTDHRPTSLEKALSQEVLLLGTNRLGLLALFCLGQHCSAVTTSWHHSAIVATNAFTCCNVLSNQA